MRMAPAKKPWITVLVLTMAGLALFALRRERYFLWFSVSIGLVGLLSRQAAAWIHIGWMFLAKVLNRIVPPILLGIVFVFVLVPIASLQKLLSKGDPLLLKNPPSSTFHEMDEIIDPEYFTRPW